MSWSLGEIATLATRAARSTGRPWGVAEEAGWAVRWLAAQGLPGPEALARWLEGGTGACPITLGLALSDTGETASAAVAGPVSEPLLLLPFLARLAPAEGALEIETATGTCRVWRDGTDLAGDLPPATGISVTGQVLRPAARTPATRVAVIEPEALAALQRAALAIFAPASEASRLKGAGAGLVDND